MKKSILLLLISILTFNLSASNIDPLEKIMLTGKVVDNDTKQPLEYATIVIKSLDGKIITGGITDTKGEFSIQVVKGVYDISVEFISFKTKTFKRKEIAGNTPAFVTGDFNAHPDDEPIQIILDAANPLRLTDSKELSQTAHYGPTGTFTGFQSKERNDQPIDYIFLKGNWKVLTHATISQTWMGRFASDHFAVMAELVL